MKKLVITLILMCTLILTGCEKNRLVCTLEDESIKDIKSKIEPADIAIGNIVGSNIFNILFIVGLSGIIIPVPYDKAFIFDSLVSLGTCVLLLLLTLRKGELKRWGGAILLLCYAAYFAVIV